MPRSWSTTALGTNPKRQGAQAAGGRRTPLAMMMQQQQPVGGRSKAEELVCTPTATPPVKTDDSVRRGRSECRRLTNYFGGNPSGERTYVALSFRGERAVLYLQADDAGEDRRLYGKGGHATVLGFGVAALRGPTVDELFWWQPERT
ncbi:hypothetical protein THAOC_31175 [Thalassiosira oceanica]|uniref:Uncharacterized protein n=1 Tax=Thalassiosira oceanica TaxID=159749 RepID=K0RLT2_THAOC|nr:hypothetical protein THAOC_31175 [Thalassiosira oceanica]|eukprot:EJK49901.1 hypothetical protein THAOC_31175 [Thalassiosira oceanica]